MLDTSLSRDSSEPGADLGVSKKKSKKNKRHIGHREKSPFPESKPCGKGALVGGLVSFTDEDDKKGYFWMQRDSAKVDEVGEMLKRSQGENGVNQDQRVEGEGGVRVSVGSAVVAEWEDALYRGVVTGKSGTSLQVHFVDWGNSDLVAKSRVRLALETELQEPALAIR